MTDEAIAQLKRNNLINRLVSIGVCTGLMLLFAGILFFTILVIQGELVPEFIAYTQTNEDGPPTNNPTHRELSSKSSAPSPTVTPSVIVANDTVSDLFSNVHTQEEIAAIADAA